MPKRKIIVAPTRTRLNAPTMTRLRLLTLAFFFTASALSAPAAEKLKALIIDGQNNHDIWPKSTIMMRQYLENTGLFTVDIARTRTIWKAERESAWLPLAGIGDSEKTAEPQPDPNFHPDFAKYQVVVSNFGWKAAAWSPAARLSFEQYMANGGGLVVVHAADNSWPDWVQFNLMIGLGGWGDRNEKNGPYVYYNNEGQLIRDPSPGPCGQHGPQNEFLITMRDQDHPITKGLPDFWLHTTDECYSHLRGPAENMTILATACDSAELKKAGRHEPMLMTINYQKGRVFHTTLGHDLAAFTGVGFITTFLRGTEWAATGAVTQAIPTDFPNKTNPTARPFDDPAKK